CFKQKTAYEMFTRLEFRRVRLRSKIGMPPLCIFAISSSELTRFRIFLTARRLTSVVDCTTGLNELFSGAISCSRRRLVVTAVSEIGRAACRERRNTLRGGATIGQQ